MKHCWKEIGTDKVFKCNLEKGKDYVYSTLKNIISNELKGYNVYLESINGEPYKNLNIFKDIFDAEIYSIEIYSPDLRVLQKSDGFHVQVKSLILGNRIDFINRDFFSQFKILERLNLSNNIIKIIELKFYSAIKHINFSNNFINQCAINFTKEVDNLDLDLGNNTMKSLPKLKGELKRVDNLNWMLQYDNGNKTHLKNITLKEGFFQINNDTVSKTVINVLKIGPVNIIKVEKNAFCFTTFEKFLSTKTKKILFYVNETDDIDALCKTKGLISKNNIKFVTIDTIYNDDNKFVNMIRTRTSIKCPVWFEKCGNNKTICDEFRENHLSYENESIYSKINCSIYGHGILINCIDCSIRNTSEIFKSGFKENVEIIINYNKIDSIYTDDMIDFPDKVVLLDLRHNQITSIAKDVFRRFQVLETILLNNNNLKEIQTIELLNVDHFEIQNNNLTKFEEINFLKDSNKHATAKGFSLDLRGNKLWNIPRFSGRISHINSRFFQNQTNTFGSNFFDLNSNDNVLTIGAIHLGNTNGYSQEWSQESFCFKNFNQNLNISQVFIDSSLNKNFCSSSSNAEFKLGLLQDYTKKDDNFKVLAANCGLICDLNETSEECSRYRFDNDTKLFITCKRTTQNVESSMLNILNFSDSNFNEIRAEISGYEDKSIKELINKMNSKKHFQNKLKMLQIIFSNFQLNDVSFAAFKNLKILDLSSNMISNLEETILPENLEELILDDNKITNISLISPKLLQFKNLKKLSLKSNLFKEIFEILPKLDELVLSDNQIYNLSENVFKNCVKLNLSNSVKSDLTELKFKDLNELDYSNNNKVRHLTFIQPNRNITLYLNNVRNERIPTIQILDGFHIYKLSFKHNLMGGNIFEFNGANNMLVVKYLILKNIQVKPEEKDDLLCFKSLENYFKIEIQNVLIDDETLVNPLCQDPGNSSYKTFKLYVVKDANLKYDGIMSLEKYNVCSVLSNSCKFWNGEKNWNCELNEKGQFYANASIDEQDKCLNYIQYKIFTGPNVFEFSFVYFEKVFISKIFNTVKLKPESVKVLSIEGSKLEAIDSLDAFSNLETLSLGDNLLTSLQDHILPFNIKMINLSQNKISNLELTKLINLKELDLSHNEINDEILMKLIKIPNNLKILKINNNKLILNQVSQFKDYDSLEELSLSNNLIEVLSANQFPQNLTHLNLNNNQISHLTYETFLNLKQLKELNLENNLLKTFEIKMSHEIEVINIKVSRNNLKNFPIIKNVFRLNLDLSGNKNLIKLKQFKEIDYAMKHIENLDISNCSISSIDDDFFFFANKLTKLNLSGNLLENIGSLSLPSISHLDLSNNKLRSINTINITDFKKIFDKIVTIVFKNNSLSSVPRIHFPDTIVKLKVDLDMSNMSDFLFNTFLESLMEISSMRLEMSKIDLSFNNLTRFENSNRCNDYNLRFDLLDLVLNNNPGLSQEIFCILYSRTRNLDSKKIKLLLNPNEDICNLISINQTRYNMVYFNETLDCSQYKKHNVSCESVLKTTCQNDFEYQIGIESNELKILILLLLILLVILFLVYKIYRSI